MRFCRISNNGDNTLFKWFAGINCIILLWPEYIINSSANVLLRDWILLASRITKFTCGPSVIHTSMRNKQVEFNPYIYTLSKLSSFGQEISVFNTHQGGIQNSRRNGHLKSNQIKSNYVTYAASWKNGCQNFSYVHRSRKHWKCKCLKNSKT